MLLMQKGSRLLFRLLRKSGSEERPFDPLSRPSGLAAHTLSADRSQTPVILVLLRRSRSVSSSWSTCHFQNRRRNDFAPRLISVINLPDVFRGSEAIP